MEISKFNWTSFKNSSSLSEISILVDTTLFNIHWWIGLLELFVFCIGVPMNLAVFYFAYSTRKRSLVTQANKRSITEMFIVSMTTADFLFCAVHAPMMFLSFNREISLSPIPCLTLFAFTHASTVASSLSLLWLNINKFLHLHRPLHYFLYITKLRAIVCILLGWFASVTWGLLFILGPFITYDSQCNIYLRHKSVYVVFATVFFVLPAIISLIISVYVAVVVVETKANNTQKSFSQYHNRRFYSADQGGPTRNDNEVGRRRNDRSSYSSLLGSTQIKENDRRTKFRVNNCHNNNNLDPNTKNASLSRSLPSALEVNYRIGRRRAFSPTHFPSPEVFREMSSSSRRMAHIRRISFVFTTTIWSTLTVLPYRLAFIVHNLPKKEDDYEYEIEIETDEIDIDRRHETSRWVQTAYFCLFAIMTLNAAGNPFITVLTQRQYTASLKELWRKLFGKKKSLSTNAVAENDGGVIANAYHDGVPTTGDNTRSDELKVPANSKNGSISETSRSLV